MCVSQSHLTLWTHELQPTRLLCSWNSPGKNTEVDSHSLLQGIFQIQGSNLGLQHCRQLLYHLSHQRSTFLRLSTFAMDMNLGKLQEIVRDMEAWHAAVLVDSKSWTWLGEWTTLKKNIIYLLYWGIVDFPYYISYIRCTHGDSKIMYNILSRVDFHYLLNRCVNKTKNLYILPIQSKARLNCVGEYVTFVSLFNKNFFLIFNILLTFTKHLLCVRYYSVYWRYIRK